MDAPQLPNDPQMEEAVLGSLLIDPQAIVTVADILRPADFFIVKHQWLYQALLELGDKADLITVAQKLDAVRMLNEMGGEAFLADLMLATATALNVEQYAQLVAGDAVRRRLIVACQEIARVAFDRNRDATTSAEQAVSIMENAASSRAINDIIPASVAADSFTKRFEARLQAGDVLSGIPTGIPELDRMTNGWQEADFNIIAGEPGGGKTSLMTQALHYAAAQFGKKCLLFTLEMPVDQMAERFVSHMSGVPYRDIASPHHLTGAEITAVFSATDRFHNLPIEIVETGYLTPSGALARVARQKRLHGLDLVAIDQLQLMAPNTPDRDIRKALVETTRCLKLLPMKTGGVPLLVLCQLNREGYGDEPTLKALKESGSIESDADKVVFVYAPNEDAKQDVTFKVGKNRKGITGKTRAKFDRATSTFVGASAMAL